MSRRAQKSWLAAALSLALCFTLLSPAQADTTRAKTLIESFTAGGMCGPTSTECTYSGQLASRKRRCLGNRTVKIFARQSNGTEQLADVERTSRSGFIFAIGRGSDTATARVVVKPRRIGPRRNRLVCKGLSQVRNLK